MKISILQKTLTIKDFILSTALVAFITLSSNVVSYLFQIFAGRNVLESIYGDYNTLNSLSMLIISPLIVLPLIIVNFLNDNSIDFKINDKETILFQIISIISLIILTSFFILINFIDQIFNLGKFNLLMTCLISILTLYVFFYLGILQQRKKYISFSLLGSSVIFLKFLFILFFIKDLSLMKLILSTIFGILIVLIINIFIFNKKIIYFKKFKFQTIKNSFYFFFKSSIYLIVLNLSIIGFTNFDIISMKILHGSYEAGIYSSAQIIAKIIYFFNSILVITLFPEVSSGSSNFEKVRKMCLFSIIFTIISSFCFVITIYFFGNTIVTFSFGERYLDDTYILLLSFSMACLSITNILITFLIAYKSTNKISYILFFLILFIISCMFLNNNIYSVAYYHAIFSLICLIFFLTYSLKVISIKK